MKLRPFSGSGPPGRKTKHLRSLTLRAGLIGCILGFRLSFVEVSDYVRLVNRSEVVFSWKCVRFFFLFN